ncbi:MAG: hypothetical protein ACREIB_09960, partial [Pseudomonadota bacterium]
PYFTGRDQLLEDLRRALTRGQAAALTQQAIHRDAAVRFLLERTAQPDEAPANELADALGDLPLALEQAAAYIGASGRSIADYLRLFRQRRPEMLARNRPRHRLSGLGRCHLRRLVALNNGGNGELSERARRSSRGFIAEVDCSKPIKSKKEIAT